MNQLDKKSYTVFLNSNDKVSGTNNNGTYQINWDDFLPRDIDFYKVIFSFQTAGGYYKDNYSQFVLNGAIMSGAQIPTFQTSALPIYNATGNYTSIFISQINLTLYALNYITVNGTNYNIIVTAGAIGNILIVEGNPIIAINTVYNGGPFVGANGSTILNYTGSCSAGQVINFNGKTFIILSVSNFNSALTQFYLKGVPTQTILPTTSILYASNGTTYNGAKIVLNTLGRSFSFDTSLKSSSLTLGYAFRDVQTSTSNSNCLSTFYMQNTPKTIARPNQNMINIQIYNNSYVFTNGLLQQNQLLVNTDYFSNPLADMTPFSLILEFIPIKED